MRTTEEKLEMVIADDRLLPEQTDLLARWVKHLRTYKSEQPILDYSYTLREFGLFMKKPFDQVTPQDIENYLEHKRKSAETVTGSRLIEVKEGSVKGYHYRLKAFYRWVLKHTGLKISPEIAYPEPKIVQKPEKSREELCRYRIEALLRNEIIATNKRGDRVLSQDLLKAKYPQLLLDEANLNILKDFHNDKIASGKVESHTGFATKIYFLKRLGLFLKGRNKTYKEALYGDIRDFVTEVQRHISSKKISEKVPPINSYKAHLLDFYRFVYGMKEEEQPRKYPEVVSWLYQKRKKSHDKVVKEVIPDNEIKAMIERCTETRDKALLALVSDSSARVGEIVNCNIGDLKINEVQGKDARRLSATIVLRGKTG